MDIVLCAFQLANQIRVGDVPLAMVSSYLTRPSKLVICEWHTGSFKYAAHIEAA